MTFGNTQAAAAGKMLHRLKRGTVGEKKTWILHQPWRHWAHVRTMDSPGRDLRG